MRQTSSTWRLAPERGFTLPYSDWLCQRHVSKAVTNAMRPHAKARCKAKTPGLPLKNSQIRVNKNRRNAKKKLLAPAQERPVALPLAGEVCPSILGPVWGGFRILEFGVQRVPGLGLKLCECRVSALFARLMPSGLSLHVFLCNCCGEDSVCFSA